MAEVKKDKLLGFRGLDLGTDPSKTGSLVIADGMRIAIDGSLTPRLGRESVSLVYPDEQFGTAADYAETIDPFRPGDTHGIMPYYDQRIETDTPEVLRDNNFRREDGIAGWTVGGGGAFTIVTTNSRYRAYVQYADLAPPGTDTLTQNSALFRQTIKPNTDYIFGYYIYRQALSGTPSNETLNVTGFATGPAMSTEAGYHEYTLRSNATLGNFVINASNVVTAATFWIMSVSLREKKQAGVEMIPQRLHYVFKAKDRLYLNKSDPAVTAANGADQLRSSTTQAKFAIHGTEVVVADESSRPRHLRRKPLKEQEHLARSQYEWTELGLRWPKPASPAPEIVEIAGGGSGPLEQGLYRFRICLVDKWGHLSNCSLPGSYALTGAANTLGIDWSHMRSDWRDVTDENPIRINIYVQYQKELSAQETASDYKLFDSVYENYEHPDGAVGDGVGSHRYREEDRERRPNAPLWERDNGHPPRLKDIIIVNGIPFGIAAPDVVYRESMLGLDERRPVKSHMASGYQPGQLEDNTRITEKKVDSSYFFWGNGKQLGSMEDYVRIGRGSEIGMGLSEIGAKVFVFTNLGIYVFEDGPPPIMKRVYSKVGCAARDSIVETERGIRFLGSDNIPRLFNGATVEEISDEVRPVFHKDDYVGYYNSFDSRFPANVTASYGRGAYYLNYPVSAEPKVNRTEEPGRIVPWNYNLALAHEGGERPQWAIDGGRALREIVWLGREGRLLGIEAATTGYAYYIEEGLTDELMVLTDIGGTLVDARTEQTIPYTCGFRWYAAADGLEGQFYQFRVEANTKGNDMRIELMVDGQPSLSAEFVMNTVERDAIDTNLPAHFKGRYLDVRFIGTYEKDNGRPEIFNHFVEAMQRGE